MHRVQAVLIAADTTVDKQDLRYHEADVLWGRQTVKKSVLGDHGGECVEGSVRQGAREGLPEHAFELRPE